MTDPIKKELPSLKPGHERLKSGVRVFRGGKVFTEQVPEEFVRPHKPSKDDKRPAGSTVPGNSSDTPKKAARDERDPGTGKGSGPAAPDEKNK